MHHVPCPAKLPPGQLATSFSPANKSAEGLGVQWLLFPAMQFFLLDDRLCYSATMSGMFHWTGSPSGRCHEVMGLRSASPSLRIGE